MQKTDKIFVAGHRGLVGSAICRELARQGYKNVLTRTREALDLLDAAAVIKFFKKEKPEYVFLAAAKVGGILANNIYPADFIYENLVIETNVIHSAYVAGVKKLLFLGSSCIYPKHCPQPMKEKYLLTGPLEPTNKAYAVAKIAGIVLCQSLAAQHGANFISVMPTNLYGPNDNFDLETSHVLPAMIRKFHDAKVRGAKKVVLWGTGSPKREFLHVDDLASACVYLMNHYNSPEIVNIGTGEDLTVKALAKLVQGIVGFQGGIVWDKTRPNGVPRKLLDVSRLHGLGWTHRIHLPEGIAMTYRWYLDNAAKTKK